MLPLWAGWAFAFILTAFGVWGILRQWRLIRPGQEGILTFLGSYLRTLGPGRHFIHPNFHLDVVPAGTSKRFHVGESATVLAPISSGGAFGQVQFGPDVFEGHPSARGQRFDAGSMVRIISARPPRAVLVGPVHSGKALKRSR